MRKQMWMLAAGAIFTLGATAAHAQGLSDMLGSTSPIPEFKDIDDNRDGYITRDEATEEDLTVARTMYEYDKDGDGQLSTAEFSALEDAEPSAVDYWHDFFSVP